MKLFKKAKRLKKIALSYLASRLTGENERKVRELFMKIDVNRDGYVTHQELEECMGSDL
jgi:Ca2+-binding EF-hand superfamily protein